MGEIPKWFKNQMESFILLGGHSMPQSSSFIMTLHDQSTFKYTIIEGKNMPHGDGKSHQN